MSDSEQFKAVGVDVGGTFTDLILLDPVAGDIRVAKVPTTGTFKHHPTPGIMEGRWP